MQADSIQLLIIEDNVLDVELVQEFLSDEPSFPVTVEHSLTLAAGLERLKDKQAPIDLALLDLSLTDAQGLDCFHQVHQAFPEVPIIILSGNADEMLAIEAVQQGAQDYMVKGDLTGKLLKRSIYYAIERQKLHLQLKMQAQQLKNLSEQLEISNKSLEKMATIDGLTQVYNRRHFDHVYAAEWNRSRRHQTDLSLLMCDIDFFKIYNDTYGHLAGDLCLQKVAQLIAKTAKRSADCVARYGGEEFIIILPHTDLIGASHLARSILLDLQHLNLAHEKSLVSDRVTMSIGAACIIPKAGVDPSILIAQADQALYTAKKKGRNRMYLHQTLPSAQDQQANSSNQAHKLECKKQESYP